MGKDTRGDWRALILLCILALAIRLAYVARVGDAAKWTDEIEYHGIALNVLHGHGYSYFRDYGCAKLGPTAYRSPGLPCTLAALYMVFGPHLEAGRVFQALLGTGVVALAWAIAAQLGYGRRAAVLAALGAAVYPYYIFCAGALYPVLIATFLVALATLLLLQGRGRPDALREALAGVSLGAAVLTFGHVLAAVPLVAVWTWANKKARDSHRPPIAAVVAVASCLVVITPWIVRNELAVGDATLSTAVAYNLYCGNRPSAAWNMGSRVSDLEPKSVTNRIVKLREGDAARLYMETCQSRDRCRPIALREAL